MTLLSGLMILVGLVGVVVPVLPGLLLVWVGVAVWAIAQHSGFGWAALAVATAITAGGSVAKYLMPGRRLREAGVPGWSLAIGAIFAFVGFFVVPVVGLFLGFVLGVFVAERSRLPQSAQAWPSTVAAVRAVATSMAIEFVTALLVAVLWVGAVLSSIAG